ncbi:ATPase components of ABC transporters with duplicated ATPase domains [Quadrisphaera granulorum]|uniref:ATPase subunit of ABC transporter with duplicated ATPase domains n=1 Tax=Quadrisphaera granulorum TaxID=317664 RepID=A0A315ZY66_9ACTN|nr:ABC-F family ATP-binding cassette domain-containing protein [Quadrisphaera granulorum]PWJ49858.1 ATPase subunit of ABC transporter with duplicated ATPase domains [Quadrisphaera granulorum]SZE98066.1 ATPase components of ABC transporters with duplicated ATPase domains [Quadrisphaera granulorum]
MSATLVARGLAAGHADRTLFSGLDLVVAPGDVVGLVGANGAGKSTLLRLLAGVDTAGADEATAGTVSLSPPGAAVGWLPQEVDRRPGETVAALLARRTGVAAAQEQLDASLAALEQGEAGSEDAYSEAFERWMALGAADLDERVPAVFADLGLGVSADALMTSLSGGQAARVGLAALLLSRFDLLLLDEPTNDLDLAGLARLERFVAEQRAGVVVVSHDREFLTRTVTTVVELDLAQQQVGVYGGGYEAYLEERAVARRHAREAYEEFADTKAGLEERARTQRAWMDKGVKNAVRKAKDPDKISKAFKRESTEKQAAKARQTERRIERLEVVEEPRKEWELRYSIAAAPRGSSVAAVLSGAVVRRGGFTLGPVNAQVDAGDRIGITGPNGAGKTTLLAALLGRAELAAGTSSLGASTQVGEVDQARRSLDDDGHRGGALLDAVRAQLPDDPPPAEVRTLLAKFGLKGDAALRPAATLSPGERTRAALAVLQARGVNLLVLDEPTNHLDLPAIEQLEAALEEYTGTLLLVSHDRRLLEAVRLTRRWHVEAGQLSET